MKLFHTITLLLLLLCLFPFPGEGAKGEEDGKEHVDRRSKKKSKSLPTKGKLTTKDSHVCSWEIAGDEELTLLVNCSHQGNNYWCKYTGRPQICPQYTAKAGQYWKQVIGKVKRKKHACEGDKTLKNRICKTGSTESQMKLTAKSSETGKRGDRGIARKKASAKVPPGKRNLLDQGDTTEKPLKNKRKPKAGNSPKKEAPTPADEVNDENSELQEELSQVYCAEQWHSLCSFFVTLWNG
ncbi:fibroblast growth factor-binding protein 3 [Callorhinchus milii]|uniref:fibroblast growth factor-binding protein 3 n=1 Tax=Callorhinchus milii TaxID=7868 RepID=UPI0004572285|nr:fibroblast growth factor-binding protein 3 [Callorhinchus milii]|eukprot:gi/632936422/ref/XP_007894882.1/ PREDICTED: fibroblast growth factor-binding protein 3 [Callorhinchus milii]